VVSKVVTDIHLFNFSVLLFCLDETVFKKVVVVLLHLLVSHVGQVRPIGRLGRVLGIDVQVLKHNRLRERRLVVQPGAAVTVTASANLEKEGTVDLVLLVPKIEARYSAILKRFLFPCC